MVTAINLCRHDQTPSPNSCYASPNRVAITFGIVTAEQINYDLNSPDVTALHFVDANTVFDVVVRLNTLGTSLRWTHVRAIVAAPPTHMCAYARHTHIHT